MVKMFDEPTLEEEMAAAEMMFDETTPQSAEPTAPLTQGSQSGGGIITKERLVEDENEGC